MRLRGSSRKRCQGCPGSIESYSSPISATQRRASRCHVPCSRNFGNMLACLRIQFSSTRRKLSIGSIHAWKHAKHMGRKRPQLNPDSLRAWLSATGYLFPRNEAELGAFESLGTDDDESDDSSLCAAIDVEGIIKQRLTLPFRQCNRAEEIEASRLHELKMVARNGKPTPQHILERMKSNQIKRSE